MMKLILIRLLLLALLFCSASHAEERILNFHSILELRSDGSMLVEERILVQAEGIKIKRGIYRDFPTTYRDKLGNRVTIGFELLSVSRDGRSEPYHTERRDNGIRIYAGQEQVFLNRGHYEYTFRYLTNRHLGFFADHDELYWNVTGNGWDFPIARASTQVRLPGRSLDGAIGLEAYTGSQGSQGREYRTEIKGEAFWFFTTAPLGRHQGLTIVVAWPKGLIAEPDLAQRLSWLLQENSSVLIALGGVALLLVYYVIAWLRVGRDPEPGVVIPEYQPPEGYSPAALRFISRMGYDNQAFSAALVNMAVKGYLRIEEDNEGSFTLIKTGEMPRLAAGEGAIASALFGAGSSRIALQQHNHQQIGNAVKVHKRALKRDYEKTYFVTNSIYLLPGILLTIAVCLTALLALPDNGQKSMTGFMLVWLSFWSVGVFALLSAARSAWRGALSTGAGYLPAIGISLFALPFLGGEVFGLYALFSQGSPLLAGVLLLLVAVNIFFYQWMKAPTHKGRTLLDRTAGFNLYLSVAEKDELNFRHPPEKTAELFERYLPFAIALGVEQRWAERFTNVLRRAGHGDSHYSPDWYHGRSWNHSDPAGFGCAMGSAMSAAIASSSSAPGSSSGSGGGGSSGGGGGGGGGGGW